MKSLGVYTKDFSLYHDILKVLKRRNLAYVSLRSPENIPKRVGIVLTSRDEEVLFKGDHTVAVDSGGSIDHALDIALQRLMGKELYSRVLVGIDPGERPGVAVVGDDIILQKDQMENPEVVVEYVKRCLDIYPAKETIVRIGHGSLMIRNRIINSLISLKIPIEIVDETSTSRADFARFRERDGAAAAAIAVLTGGKVQTRLPLEPTRGAIKNIQKKSRDLSEGRFTISEKTAIAVLQGKMSLLEAIESEE
jgi:hypothetical protein